jgi:hypothetical protein
LSSIAILNIVGTRGSGLGANPLQIILILFPLTKAGLVFLGARPCFPLRIGVGFSDGFKLFVNARVVLAAVHFPIMFINFNILYYNAN